MTKSRSKSRSHNKKKRASSLTPKGRNSLLAQPSAAPTLTAMAPLSKSTVSGGTASRKILSYTYVFRDLRRISILAGTAFAILIVLAIILR